MCGFVLYDLLNSHCAKNILTEKQIKIMCGGAFLSNVIPSKYQNFDVIILLVVVGIML